METPRRRRENRERLEKTGETERIREETGEAAAPRETEGGGKGENADINGAEKCVRAVKVLIQELNGAKKTLMNSENCVVNRPVMLAQLEYLNDNLPDTVRRAADIVAAEAAIRKETEEKRQEIIGTAESQAQQTVSESRTQAQNLMDQANQEARALMDRANQEANKLMDQANQEATACVEAARAEAARMLEDAEKKARQLIEEENIVRRARVESDEIREKAQQETAQLQKNALEFVDRQLMDADRAISEMLNSIRLERNEVRNRRQ